MLLSIVSADHGFLGAALKETEPGLGSQPLLPPDLPQTHTTVPSLTFYNSR